MRYAILSDIHANIEALTAVLEQIGKENVDQLICLGDIVGYNANPNECVDLVRELRIRTIAGNHDRAAIGKKDPSGFGENARRAIEWTKRILTRESAAFLATLPATLTVDDRFFLVHGALHPEPRDDFHLSNPLRVERSFRELRSGRFGTKICLFGHTHHPIAFEHSGSAMRKISPQPITLDERYHYLINPGSVGQSRDYDARAAFLIFDTRRNSVEWRRVAYDVSAVMQKNRALGLSVEPFLRRQWSRIRAALGGY